MDFVVSRYTTRGYVIGTGFARNIELDTNGTTESVNKGKWY